MADHDLTAPRAPAQGHRDYREFLAARSQLGGNHGFAPLWMPEFLFDFQKHLVEWAIRKGRAAIFADTGLGKAQPADEIVLTPGGWRAIGELAVGDEVVGSSGRPVRVTGVYPQGRRATFRIVFSDGAQCRADGEHLWSVSTDSDAARGRGDGRRVLTTAQIADSLRQPDGRLQWRVPTVVVAGDKIDLPLDPYVLGILIGDGSIGSGSSPSFTSVDEQIASEVSRRLPPGFRCVSKQQKDRAPTHWICREAGPGVGSSESIVLASLRGLGLWGCRSWEKFVPPLYLGASAAQRSDLLRGLMDTDGWTGSATQFTTTSPQLAADVCSLARSLGGTARLSTKSPTYVYRQERCSGRPAFNVTLKVPFTPFRLDRKRSAYEGLRRTRPCRKIAEVIDDGDAECVCIRVDAPDSLYVTRDYVVTHNTAMQLVWAENVVRKTNRPVLILTPLAVGPQTVREGARFGVEAEMSRGEVRPGARVVVVNYQKLHHFSPADFAGCVCDESSVLKNFDGKTKAAVTEFLRMLPYRLLCTATAAPNDEFELGTSSEALGEMGHQDMLGRFFRQQLAARGTVGWGHDTYALRSHAERDFWRWVCSWGRACRRPSDLGFDDGPFALPPLETACHPVQSDRPAPGLLFALPAVTLAEQRDEERRTVRERCELAARLADHGEPAVAWCFRNDEGDLLERLIPGAVQVSGSDPDEAKEEKLEAFASGQARVMVTKPRIAGFGLNWQHCARQVFFPSHSFESYYQAVRRCWRFGQKRPVKVDVVTTEGGAGVMANLRRKSEAADRMFRRLVELMNQSLRIDRPDPYTKPAEAPSWL